MSYTSRRQRSIRSSRTATYPFLVIALVAVAGCSPQSDQRTQADAAQAAHQTGVALNRAAADTRDTVDDLAAGAKPTVDRVAHDTERGVDALAVGAGKVTVKAGAALERAGARHRAADDRTDDGGSDAR